MTTETSTAPSSTPPEPALVSQFLAEAGTAVAALADETGRIAGLFRRHDLKPANESLAVLPAELRNFIVAVSVVEGQLGIDPASLTIDDLTPSDQIVRLSAWLESLIDAQANEDGLTIADILEFDLEPFLQAWAALLANQPR